MRSLDGCLVRTSISADETEGGLGQALLRSVAFQFSSPSPLSAAVGGGRLLPGIHTRRAGPLVPYLLSSGATAFIASLLVSLGRSSS